MAEELIEKEGQTELKARCNELFSLLSKPDLTPEEKEKVSALVKVAPQLLLQKEFIEKFEMPSLLTEYKSGKDVNDIVPQSAKSVTNMKFALDNLKTIGVPTKDGEQSAATYMLNNAYLPNGELIGTQLAKNIHFLGTAKKDETHRFDEDKEIDTKIRSMINEVEEYSIDFYKTLYEKPDGYCADQKSRNAAGQQVESLMKKCCETQDTKIEDLYSREFMRDMDSEYVEHRRGEMVVSQLESTKTLTVENMTDEQLEAGDYQGTLTVGQKELLNKKREEKKKKEVPLKQHQGNKVGGEEKGKHEPFKEGDVIKYMYEEWFLAGMSWLFDKVEDGLDAFLNNMVEHRRESLAHSEEMAKRAKDEREKAFFEKVAFFDKMVLKKDEDLTKRTQKRVEKWKTTNTELLDYFEHPTPEKESAIKAKFSHPEFVDKLKRDYEEDPSKIKEFLEQYPRKIKQVLKNQEIIERLANQQVAVEMMDEVMRSTGAWHQKGTRDLRKDEDLTAEFDKRAKARKAELFETVSVVSEDARILAKTAWKNLETEEEKRNFVQKNVFDFYDKLIEKTEDSETKNALREESRAFADMFYGRTEESRKMSEELRQEMLFERVAALKVDLFMADQTNLTHLASAIQNKDRAEGEYQITSGSPSKKTKKLMEEARENREKTLREGMNDAHLFPEANMEERIESKRSLLEAAVADNEPVMYEGVRTELDRKAQELQNDRINPDIYKEFSRRKGTAKGKHSPLSRDDGRD